VNSEVGGPVQRRGVRIGLTGPIGCGKSKVASWLGERGAIIIDADLLAREVVEPGQPAFAQVVDAFGLGIVTGDGRLDRSALGRIVFADPAALARLEAIVHPAVRPRIVAAVSAAEVAFAPIVAIEAIRLVEAGYAAECDEVWLIVCDPGDQARRLRGRGISDGDAAQRIAAQGDPASRLLTAATRVIDTSGSPEIARAKVGAAIDAALNAAAERSPVAIVRTDGVR
jgi:dephospho-CoA kinase